MTTERPTYNAHAYVSDRPSYPSRVYEILEAYHRAGGGTFEHAIDLGCGPGFMALQLSKAFERVTGLDPEEGMVGAGLQPEDGKKITYHVGTAESLASVGIEDNSVDLVVAGEAAHYFNFPVAYPELARVLKPSGTIAWVGYGRLTFRSDEVNNIVGGFMSNTLGPYWTEPGWSISEGLYDRIPFPVAPKHSAETEKLLASLPDLEAVRVKSGTAAGKWYLRKTWTPQLLEKCFRTWSSVKRYQDKHSEDGAAELDVVQRVMAQISPLLGDEFEVVWPFVIMMIRRDAA